MAKTPAQAPTAGSHLAASSCPPAGRGIKPKAHRQYPYEGSGPNPAMQNPADITGIRWAANQDSGICVNLLLRCPMASAPAVSVGWLGLRRDRVSPGASSRGGWRWALGCPACAAVGRSRNVGLALPGHGAPVPLRARVLLLTFPARGSEASRDGG